jgi:hypothetical protein
MGLLFVVKSAPLNENHSHLEFEPKKKPTQFKIINNFKPCRIKLNRLFWLLFIAA